MSNLLHRGSRGPAVEQWQYSLRSLGFRIPAEGVFGPATEQATRELQKRVGIHLDGVVGDETRKAAQTLLLRGEPVPQKPVVPPAPVAAVVARPGQYPEEIYQTPNYSEKPNRPAGIVIHHTCGSWEGDTAWIMNPANPKRDIFASYHCLINRDGARRKFAEDQHRVWHAGTSSWRGRSDCNSWMLGVAFSGDSYPDRRHGFDLNTDHLASLIEWCKPRIEKYNIPAEMVTDHRQVAPGRKTDINPAVWPRVIKELILACYG